jgi:uncharacterized membrane protein
VLASVSFWRPGPEQAPRDLLADADISPMCTSASSRPPWGSRSCGRLALDFHALRYAMGLLTCSTVSGMPRNRKRAASRFKVFLHQLRVRPRLVSAVVVGAATVSLLPTSLAAPTRALLAWDFGAGLYLVLAWLMMLRAEVDHMRGRAQAQDDGAAVVLVLTVLAAIASLAAIMLELAGVKNYSTHDQGMHLALAAFTIVCSWLFVHTAFALHYAHEFYMAVARDGQSALEFPRQDRPDYWDFLYFSFVIGTTSQTADVSIASAGMRRLALLHGIVAFFFNTTLLALTINIAAGLI